jgi:hypothetical protein
VVGADVHPAGVGGEVIDAVGDCLAQVLVDEVVRAHRHRAALGPVLLPAVGEVPDQLLLLGIHADHRVPGVLAGPGLLADVAELRVPVRVLGTFNGLGVALQAEPFLP